MCIRDRGDPINNPWTGTGESGSPEVFVPLNTLSNVNGEDLEIKLEIDIDQTTQTRFYKGWRLDEVFNYDVRGTDSTNQTSMSYKINESDEWQTANLYREQHLPLDPVSHSDPHCGILHLESLLAVLDDLLLF